MSSGASTAFMRALEHCLKEQLTFVAFRPPGSSFQLFIQKQASCIEFELPDLPDAVGFVSIPFRSDRSSCILIQGDVRMDENERELPEGFGECVGATRMNSVSEAMHDTEAQYIEKIIGALEHLREGGLKKVVLSRTAVSSIDPSSIPSLLVNAAETYPSAMVHLQHTPKFGTWIGASPERSLQLNAGMLAVDSVAGTLVKDMAPKNAKDWGLKELKEQALVTQHVRHTFNDLEMKKISTSGPSVLYAGPVAHLFTKLSALLGAVRLGTVIQQLHPTPAVAGTPRHEALELIDALEGHDRSLYAGVVGQVENEAEADLYVNIRCMQLLHDKAVMHVGGGITVGSDPKKEWEETEQKATTWRQLMSQLRTKSVGSFE